MSRTSKILSKAGNIKMTGNSCPHVTAGAACSRKSPVLPGTRLQSGNSRTGAAKERTGITHGSIC